jgi:EF-P beta-lysylation protein EpmB
MLALKATELKKTLMIQSSSPYWQGELWKKALADAIKNPCELFAVLNLPHEYLPAALEVSKVFPLRVTRSFVARMQPGNIHDPLLLQVLPLHMESTLTPGYSTDPVGDLGASKYPGVLHKYHGRVLLVTTGACAVHCRYCFRRHFPYSDANPSADHWQNALQYIAGDSSINEVILSGGDPLSLSDHKLLHLATRLANIPHISTLRIHSRLPVVLPQRISDALIGPLTATRLQIVMVIHANHVNEIDTDVITAMQRLQSYGIQVLNQSVLLRRVNDEPTTLANLSKTLFAHGVMPYYLHTLDKVQGAAHFAVDGERMHAIYTELSRQLPGYLLPKLVTEHAGAAFKTPVYNASPPE